MTRREMAQLSGVNTTVRETRLANQAAKALIEGKVEAPPVLTRSEQRRLRREKAKQEALEARKEKLANYELKRENEEMEELLIMDKFSGLTEVPRIEKHAFEIREVVEEPCKEEPCEGDEDWSAMKIPTLWTGWNNSTGALIPGDLLCAFNRESGHVALQLPPFDSRVFENEGFIDSTSPLPPEIRPRGQCIVAYAVALVCVPSIETAPKNIQALVRIDDDGYIRIFGDKHFGAFQDGQEVCLPYATCVNYLIPL